LGNESNGYYEIRAKFDINNIIDAWEGRCSSGTEVHTYKPLNTPNQKWAFFPGGAPTNYPITS